MTLAGFKKQLESVNQLQFVLQNGQKVPSHFHITEIGLTTKQFTDCGNTFRTSKKITFQLWSSVDIYHRLEAQKVLKIINSVTQKLETDNLEIEIEYQQDTIGKFGLDFIDNQFVLTNTFTDCLDKSSCGFPSDKIKSVVNDLKEKVACCTAESNCC